MKNIIFSAILTSLTSLPGQSQDIHFSKLKDVADSVASIQLQQRLTPGLSLAISVDGRTVLTKGYGLADVEMGVEATPETVYKTGSISKQFTAAAIMKLVEEGKVLLDKPVSDYIPNYDLQGRNLTVRHLLNHTSGISIKQIEDTDNYKKLLLRPELDLSHKDLLDLLSDGPFVSEPGEKFAYSNLGYMILGIIISNVTDKTYAQYMEENLFKPLGLKNTIYCDFNRIIPNRAEGYDQKDGKLFNARYISMYTPGGAGGICSTIEDLLQWNHLLYSGKVISPASLKEMTSETELTNGKLNAYGYGVKLNKLGEHPVIFHGGSISGFQSLISYYPEAKLSIAVLMNSGTGDPEKIEEAIARSAFGIEIYNISLSPEEMVKFEGDFTLVSPKDSLELRIFQQDGQLKADIGGEGVTPLLYQGNNTFIAAFDKNIKMVVFKEEGFAHHITFNAFGDEYLGSRKQ